MKATGQLHKMSVKQADPIEYSLMLDQEVIRLNDYLGQPIAIQFLGQIHCIQCGRQTKKSFQQGYCYPCMKKINECNNCIIHPERCLVESSGGCKEDDWAHAHCHQPQVVYLANSSGLKVGITRTSNQLTRWIDQGAVQALPIFQTKNRYQCGLLEVALKQYVADKTNWRNMLKGLVAPVDLQYSRERLLDQASDDLVGILEKYASDIKMLEGQSEVVFHYPVLSYPEKIKTHNLDKTPEISGILQGIKGQYLILDTGVFNVRKFGGYVVNFSGVT